MSHTMKDSVAKLTDEYGSRRRRTQRVKIAIPIAVRIPKANASFYEEAAETIVVNAQGCLVRLSVPLEQGQQIHIINSQSAQEQASLPSFGSGSSPKARRKWDSSETRVTTGCLRRNTVNDFKTG